MGRNPLRSILLRLSRRPRLGEILERLPAARRFVRRFVAGTTLDDALGVIARLNAAGLAGAVTYLGENVGSAAEAAQATATYGALLDAVATHGLRAVPSLKLTHLGLDLGEAVCLGNVTRVLERAAGVPSLVWIDMESSRYTEPTLAIHARLRRRYPHVACVVQAYLRRTPADLEPLIELGATVRLCKGAYREPAELAYPVKADVDQAYAALMDRLLGPEAQARRVYVGFATHDERLIARARERARAGGVGPDRFEMQMLYGIRHDLHRRLPAEGLALRVLVPFGPDWYGYFMRRLAERPANLVFFLRHLVRPGGAHI